MGTPALMPPPSAAASGPATPGTPPPTSPPIASPAPAKPSPALQRSTEDILNAVRTFRDIAQNYPAASKYVQVINEQVREIMRVVMEHQETGEPAAPPIAG